MVFTNDKGAANSPEEQKKTITHHMKPLLVAMPEKNYRHGL
jgi:hypothetical protein